MILLQVCRICLTMDVKMYDMGDYNLDEMYEQITGILVRDIWWERGSILNLDLNIVELYPTAVVVYLPDSNSHVKIGPAIPEKG